MITEDVVAAMAAAKKQVEGIEEEMAEASAKTEQGENHETRSQEKQAQFIKQIVECGYSEELAVKAYQNASPDAIANDDVSEGEKGLFVYLIIMVPN